jgi:hypothetical protein
VRRRAEEASRAMAFGARFVGMHDRSAVILEDMAETIGLSVYVLVRYVRARDAVADNPLGRGCGYSVCGCVLSSP